MKKSQYMNQDGTFKNGFDGCVLHMTKVEGKSGDMAKKICGAIAQQKMANRHAPLLNREGKLPPDGYFQVVPKGLSWNEDAGVWQLLDDSALDAMVNSFRPPLLVDEEHWSYDPSKSSQAMGWGQHAVKRDDGMYVKIDLTDIGNPAVVNKRLIYPSPAFLPEDCVVIADNVVRPMRLDTIGLTNSANMKGLLKPLTNRAAEAEADATKQPTGENAMKESVIAILGVPADTADSVVLEQLRALKNRADIAAEVAKALGIEGHREIVNRVATLVTDHKALLESQVDSDLKEFENVIANKETMKKQLLANRAGTIELLKSLKVPAKLALHNRAGKRTPDSADADGGEKDAEEKRARAIKNRAVEIRKGTPAMTFEQAWKQAEDEQAAKQETK